MKCEKNRKTTHGNLKKERGEELDSSRLEEYPIKFVEFVKAVQIGVHPGYGAHHTI